MRSGLETTSNRNYGAWVRSAQLGALSLWRSRCSTPRARRWTTAPATRICSRPSSPRPRARARCSSRRRRSPRRSGSRWRRGRSDPQGIYFGGNDMAMTPRQMLAFGELYLRPRAAPTAHRCCRRGGCATRWCRAAGHSRRSATTRYGYGWWMRPMAGQRDLLRLGIRRSVHLRRAGARAGGRHHVGHGHRRRATSASAHGERAGGGTGHRAAGGGALEFQPLSARAGQRTRPQTPHYESVIRRAAAARGSCSRTTP